MKSNRSVLFTALLCAALIALTGNILGACTVAVVGSAASVPWSQHREGVFCFNPLMLHIGPLMDPNPDNHGGGLGEVIAGVKDIKGYQEKLLENYTQLDGKVKKSLEDFDKAAKRLDSVEDITRSMQRLMQNLRQENRSVHGCPARRIDSNVQLRNTFQLALIRGLNLMGDLPQKQADRWAGIAKDLDTANTPGSTYIANNELEREIYDLLATYGDYSVLDVRMVGAKATEIRLKTARPGAFFVDEAAAIGADSNKAGSKVAVTPKKIGGLLSVSSELLEDDATGVVEDILNDMAEDHAERIDHISYAATGASDNVDGGFTGMFTGGTARTAASGNVSIATIDYEDVLACVTNAPSVVFKRQPKWFIHPNVLAKLMLIKDGNGRPIFQSALEAPSYGALGTILGFPVVPVSKAPSTDGTSKLLAAFGDPRGLGVRIRRGVVFDRSKDWAFDTDEITFRALSRAAAKVKIATAFQVLKTAAS